MKNCLALSASSLIYKTNKLKLISGFVVNRCDVVKDTAVCNLEPAAGKRPQSHTFHPGLWKQKKSGKEHDKWPKY